MSKLFPKARWAVLLLFAAIAPGCLAAAAGAGAGAAGATYLNDRAASSLVEASLETVAERTRQAFGEFQIEMTGEESHEFGNDMEIKGTNGALEITVDLERRGPASTFIEVSARDNALAWNKDYATRLMARIIEIR